MNELATIEDYQRALAEAKTVEEAGILRAKIETIAKQIAPRLKLDRYKWNKGNVEACVKHGKLWNACENKWPKHKRKDIASEDDIKKFISLDDAHFKNNMDAMLCSRIASLDPQDLNEYFDDCRLNGKFPTLGGAHYIWEMLNPLDSPPPSLLPRGKYHIIYADPPWRYDFSKSPTRTIERHYPTMSLQEICDLRKEKIDKISGDDCVLFLWATSPKLREALKVIDAWGFDYKTSMVWVKDRWGMGYYARQQHELLLIAAKGKLAQPKESDRQSSVINAARTNHSVKPMEAYVVIEIMYPEHKKIELFARNKRKGWASWGLEI